MKHQGRKQKRLKDKTCKVNGKETSLTEEDEVTRKGTGDNNSISFTDNAKMIRLFCADPYSFYERNSIREEKKKNHGGSELGSKKNRDRERKLDIKRSDDKSSLPPLTEKTLNGKQSVTFGNERRAMKHSLLNHTKIAVTSEFQKRLALSLSFAGIYDLDEMSRQRKGCRAKKGQKIKGILKSSNSEVTECNETLNSHTESEDLDRRAKAEDSELPKCYVIKTLILEKERPSFQNKLILPKIKGKSSVVPTKSVKSGFHCDTTTHRRKENKLPRIGKNENRTLTFAKRRSKRRDSHGHKRKVRFHNKSFERDYSRKKMPFLPVLVNGRSKFS